MTINVEDVTTSISELRDYVALENKRFIQNVTEINEKFIKDMDKMRLDISQLYKIDKEDKVDLMKTNAVIEGEKIKIAELFVKLEKVDKEVKRLDDVKQN